MTNITGGLSMEDLRAVKYASAAKYGLDTINTVLQDDLNLWEQKVQQAVADYCETTSDRQRIWGNSAAIDFNELGEFGLPVTNKNQTGNTIGFKLNRFAAAVGYTDMWFQTHTPAEMVERQLQIERGHNERILKELKKAIYTNTNSTFSDWLVDRVNLYPKAFMNADGSLLPDAPDGTKFDGSTHQHYLARSATLAASDIDALVAAVHEHGYPGLVLHIALADLPSISALTGFTALSAPFMNYFGTTSTQDKLDVAANPSNRLVGFWGVNMIPVYTRYFALAGYAVCMALDASEKPLVRRVHTEPSLQGLRIEAKIGDYPLNSDNYVSLEGFSVWNRLAGAVMYLGGTTYVAPTIL